MYTKLERKNTYDSDLITFYLTSRKNSPGSFFHSWKDGKPLQISMKQNTFVRYNVQPQITKYLEQMGKCQKESYYECLASQLDANNFKECSEQCIPNVFSNLNKTYGKPFCQNDIENEVCALRIAGIAEIACIAIIAGIVGIVGIARISGIA